jgi:hypothetical protein
MSEPATGATRAELPPPDPRDASTAELVGSLTEQLGTLVRDEVRLAQAEITQKAKRLGVGAGPFGGAGLVAVLGLNALSGKKGVRQAAPPLPTETIASVRADVAAVKESVSR